MAGMSQGMDLAQARGVNVGLLSRRVGILQMG